MKHTLTYTDNYILVLSDEEIKEGDWVANNLGLDGEPLTLQDVWRVHHYYGFQPITKKIIAHLPLNNPPYLEGVDLLPKITQEDNIEQLAWDNPCLSRKDVYKLFNDVFKDKRMDGQYSISASKQVYEFNHRLRELAFDNVEKQKAREKYRFTEEDLIKAIDMARLQGSESFLVKYTENKIIQSLNQPKRPVAFECETQQVFINEHGETSLSMMSFGGHAQLVTSRKTITNSEGKTEWVGKYIYE